MRLAYLLSGGPHPVMKKFQIGEAMATAGVPVVIGGAGNGGLSLGTTTANADCVGITVDSQDTFVTAQQSDASDPARAVSVIVSPDACYKAKLSGGATSNTQLGLETENTGSTTGLIVTSGTDFTNFDEGAVWGYAGGNPGVLRKIITGDATDANVEVAFPNDIAVGDTFIVAPFYPGENQFVQLSTTLEQVDASAAVDSDNNNFRVIEIDQRDAGDDGRNTSSVVMKIFDHLYASGGSV